ncbi:Fic family protein [Candidatus Micrarchaeota archaeon]|nr:Fic family protein [Candidatus Micrarchaeota archaeon]
MAFIREKTKGVTTYYQLVESVREKGKVRQKTLKYFGSKTEMVDFCMKNGIERPKENDRILDPPIIRKLEGKLKELNAKRPLPPASVESLHKKFDVEMTYNSNAIEGNRLTLRETYLVLERGLTIGGKSMKEHLEATNHRDAIHFLGQLAKKKKVTEKDILDIHALILDKIDPTHAGFYRQEQVFITGTKHIPPKWTEVPKKMKAALIEANSTANGAKAVESAARLHHLITSIHPFIDGNGRLSRLLCNLRLMRAGFPPIVLQKKIKLTYYSALEKADVGDLKPLTLITARDVQRALDLWLSATK